MDLMTYRAYISKMLSNETTEVTDEAIRRMNLTLNLLGSETMSIEGVAIIISMVKSDKELT